jgi:hypothetical protein
MAELRQECAGLAVIVFSTNHFLRVRVIGDGSGRAVEVHEGGSKA